MHRTAILVLTAFVFFSCGESPSSTENAVFSPLHASYPEKGIVHWSSFLWWDDETIEEASEASMAIFPMQFCVSSLGEEVIGKIKDHNPDFKIIGYQGMLCVADLYQDTAYVRQTTPYELDYWYICRDRWAWTTAGDTLHIWPGITLINPFDGGSLDTGLMTDIVDLIEGYRSGKEDCLDGIMHDYFMYRPYISYYLGDAVIGEIDLDGNGMPVGEDAGERELFLRWQIDFAAELRDRFGPDFIQVGNGRVPQENAELAGLINGIFYELYPNMCWSITDRDGLQTLIANQADGWLAKAHGRTWSILTNDAVEYNNYFCLISSLLAGCMYAELYDRCVFAGWSLELSPGMPLSQLIVEGSPDSMMTYRRIFSSGEARISFADYGGRTETVFIED